MYMVSGTPPPPKKPTSIGRKLKYYKFLAVAPLLRDLRGFLFPLSSRSLSFSLAFFFVFNAKLPNSVRGSRQDKT